MLLTLEILSILSGLSDMHFVPVAVIGNRNYTTRHNLPPRLQYSSVQNIIILRDEISRHGQNYIFRLLKSYHEAKILVIKFKFYIDFFS